MTSRVLLDTHVALSLSADPTPIGPHARATIEGATFVTADALILAADLTGVLDARR